jgi:N-acetylmuramoyl-L-alanine amidase
VGDEGAVPALDSTGPDTTVGPTPTAGAADGTTLAPPGTTVPPASADRGVVVVPTGGAPLSTEPGGEPFIQIHENVVLGAVGRSGEYLEVVTMCNETAWVGETDVTLVPAGTRAPPGPGFDLSGAVIVVDPGHGDRDWGGVGPEGLGEKTVNLDISERIRDLLEAPHTVDWSTGAISDGSDVPAVEQVWLTRDRSGPNEGDFELGLGFRAELANAAGADVFASIHNNTVPRIDTDIPGTEIYYAMGVEQSDRLASLIYEELLRSFSSYTVEWTGGEVMGPRSRFDPATNDDYYGLLRRAEMPAVIVEGVYIDQASQEALLETEEFRQSYAEGVYRGIVRFLTTDDIADGINEPEPFPDDAGTVNTSECPLPEQQ